MQVKNSILDILADLINSAMKKKGIDTPNQLSRESGVSQPTLSRLFAREKAPKSENLYKLLIHLDLLKTDISALRDTICFSDDAIREYPFLKRITEETNKCVAEGVPKDITLRILRKVIDIAIDELDAEKLKSDFLQSKKH